MLFLIFQLEYDLIDIIKTRRSVREFIQREIHIDILKNIVDAGRFAPSPHNIQPWEFIIIRKKENRDSVFKHLRWLFEPDKNSRPTAYILVITERENLKNVPIVASIGSCVGNICLAAWSYGIGSCWIGSIEKKKELEKFLNIPEEKCIFAVIALGYPENIPIAIERDSILKPYKIDNKIYIPKKRLEEIMHIENFKQED